VDKIIYEFMEDTEEKIDELEEKINKLESKSLYWDIASVAIGGIVAISLIKIVFGFVSNLFSF
jgi:hypothetical protein